MRNSTKSCDFSEEVKKRIAERDSIDNWPCCIRCGSPAPSFLAYSNAHFIPRSQGGLGIEENGMTLCPVCHVRFDQSEFRHDDKVFYEEYLRSHYKNWDKGKLVYRRM